MGDPVTAGVVGSVVPGFGGAVANPLISSLAAGATAAATAGSTTPWSMGAILNGIGTNLAAGGDVGKGLAMNASALAGSQGFGSGGGSLFGFEGPMTSIGRVIEPVTSTISGANTFMNQNPVTSQIGFSLANQMLQPSPVSFAQPGQVSRGQIQPMDYMSLLNPQQQQVIMPATPSLIQVMYGYF